MTDLVVELRKRAEDFRRIAKAEADSEHDTLAASYGERSVAYDNAANLLEADPLYRAAPELLWYARAVHSSLHPSGTPTPNGAECGICRLLATLPKDNE